MTQIIVIVCEDKKIEKRKIVCRLLHFILGTGKSATISKCTRRPVSSGNGRDRVTVRCAKYDLRSDAREELKAFGISISSLDLIWVDTVGWDDADLQG